MTTDNKPRRIWKWRSLVSFYLLFAGVAMLISGLVLYVSPPGRVAHSTGWQLLGLGKEQWEAVHTLFSYTGTIFGIAHLVLNWKVLLNYLRSRTHRAYRLRAELVIALLLTIIVGVGSALHLPPFGAVMDWSETLKDSWDTRAVLPITSEEHEEEAIPTHETVTEEHAEEIIPTQEAATEEYGSGGAGTGWGQFTVGELCAQEGIPVADGLAHLEEYGMKTDASSRIRTLADSSSYAPSEVADIVRGLEPGASEEHE